MNNPLKKGGSTNRPRKGGLHTQSRHHHVTKSGNKIKLNRNIIGKMQARKDARLRKKAAYLATLPKGRLQRTLYRLHPRRQFKYWFSREGGIMALKVAGIGALASFLLLIGVFAYFRKDLPNLRDISGNNIGGSIRYFDRTGEILLWEDYDAVKRNPVQDENISQTLKDATIAVEDKDFFEHGGFDVKGIARAGVSNTLGSGGTQQGGSTITQQLVKLTQNWSRDKTYTRKVKELILSVELERTYSKKEILAAYLNTAPYGDITYGAEAAMQDYFKKPAKDITLDEAAFLAAIPQSPTYYSPYGARYDKEALVGRQHYVLDLMTQQGKITSEQRDEAKKIDTVSKMQPRTPKYENIQAPWFVLTAKEQLLASRPETAKVGGMKVTTTLDMEKQKLAEEQVAKGIKQVTRQGGDTIAFAAEDVKTGQMVALVGGVDFNNPDYGQNNYARLKLPPGSSYKPYDYAALIEHTTNSGAGSVLYDTQGPLEGYPCTNKSRTGNCLNNYDFRYPGPLTLRYALGGSRNVPAAKAMLTVGVQKTIDTSKKMMQSPGSKEGEARGDYKCYQDDELTKEKQCYAAASIGDGAFLKLDEHVHGIATLSRNGKNIPQTYILKIEDARGKTVEEWQPSEGVQAIRDESAYIVSDMMSDPKASYMARKAHNYKGWKFGLKTGTTNDSKDGWMVGMSTQYAVATWVGYHDRTKELSGFMENMTQPIVSGWMNGAHDKLKPEERPKPAGIQTLPAYVVRTHVGASSVEPSPATDLFPSWYKKVANNKKQTIDIVSNKLATDCTPAKAKKDASNAMANTFSSDRFNGTAGVTSDEKDDVHRCEDAKPSITLTAAGSGKNYTFTATASQGTHPISSDKFQGKINFTLDGNVIKSFDVNSSPATVSFQYTASVSGSHAIMAEITDSVLYDASDSKTVDFGTAATETITLQQPSGGPDNFSFTWDTLPGLTYELCVSSTTMPQQCSTATTGSARTVTGPNKKAFVRSNNGVTSNIVGF